MDCGITNRFSVLCVIKTAVQITAYYQKNYHGETPMFTKYSSVNLCESLWLNFLAVLILSANLGISKNPKTANRQLLQFA